MKWFSKCLCTCILILIARLGYCQQIVSGTISDVNSKPIANVKIIDTASKLVVYSNAAGEYSIVIQGKLAYLQFTKSDYQQYEAFGLELNPTTETTFNVILKAKKVSIGEVKATATAKKESISTLVNVQKKSSLILDAISAETIKQMPARSTADVVKRMNGVSIADNKYIVIRGLSDRYNCVTYNGSILPSTDPDRKTFSFDIFPSNAIQNIQIYKTATPENSAEFAGGLILLNTKDAAKAPSASISVGTSVNSLAFGNMYFNSNFSNTKFLGISPGLSLPANTPNTDSFRRQSFSSLLNWNKNLKNNFEYRFDQKRFAAPNLSLAINKSLYHKGNRGLYVFASASYNRTFRKDTYDRVDTDDDKTISFKFRDEVDKDNLLLSGMLNLTYAHNKKHTLTLKSITCKSVEINDMQRQGIRPSEDFQQKQYVNSYLSTAMRATQLGGEHKFNINDSLQVKADWLLGVSSILRDQPDLRSVIYNRSMLDSANTVYTAALGQVEPNVVTAGRFYSKLNELVPNALVNIQLPFKLLKQEHKLKLGVQTLSRDRNFTARRFGYVVDIFAFTNRPQLQPIDLFSTDSAGKDGILVKEGTQPQDDYTATSTTNAGYVMSELNLADNFTIVGGVRYEQFKLDLNSNDGLKDRTYSRRYNNLLPSVIATYEVTKKSNLRASYCSTVSRPEFREIAPFAFYDFNTNSVLVGTQDLQQATIGNYDVRFENYGQLGEIFTFALFNKTFNKPIEQVFFSTGAGSQTRQFKNSDNGRVYGVEIEARKNAGTLSKSLANSFLNDITLYTNLAYCISRVQITNNNIITTRPMQGQSRYIANASVSYSNKALGINTCVMYNKIGERISMVGDNTEATVWEKPRNLLDISISKMIHEKIELRLNLSDILANDYILYQNQGDGNNNSRFSSSSHVFVRQAVGSNTSFTITYKFK
jgi:outer membrane receptor protein involved in Fe transport